MCSSAPATGPSRLRSTFIASSRFTAERPIKRTLKPIVTSAQSDDIQREAARLASIPSKAGQIERVKLRRPMGMILEEDNDTRDVFVAEVTPGGAADRCGKVRAGDLIKRLSATFVTDPGRGLTESRMIDAKGLTLKTVIGAIDSNILCRTELTDGSTTFELEHRA